MARARASREGAPPAVIGPAPRRLSPAKRLLFSLLPLLVVVAVAESAVRLAGLDRPALQSTPLPEELAGLVRADPILFWSLTPDTRRVWRGTQVTINHEGTRGAELPPPRAGALRILSLGESTTFGVNVSDGETYSARLEQFLREALPRREVTVINAGVSAYSSFQSLRYLEHRGLALRPDVVLLYHELNDYLPTSLRDASNNEVGALATDRQLYESRTEGAGRWLMRWSAVYRWLAFRRANAAVRRFDQSDVSSPLVGIGLPGYTLPPLFKAREDGGATPASERALGRRVSDVERQENLERMLALCREHGVTLIVIHPSYRDSARHECLLTRFCAERRVTMVEAFESLHPDGFPPGALFTDAWHPTPEGHFRLARELSAAVLAGPAAAPR